VDYAPKNRLEKLLEMDETEIANVIDTTWNESQELREKAAATDTRYNIAFAITLVIGVAMWFLGGSHLFVFALFTFGALIKVYGLTKVTRFELNIAMNNQVVAQFTVAGIAKKMLGHTSK